MPFFLAVFHLNTCLKPYPAGDAQGISGKLHQIRFSPAYAWRESKQFSRNLDTKNGGVNRNRQGAKRRRAGAKRRQPSASENCDIGALPMSKAAIPDKKGCKKHFARLFWRGSKQFSRNLDTKNGGVNRNRQGAKRRQPSASENCDIGALPMSKAAIPDKKGCKSILQDFFGGNRSNSHGIWTQKMEA